MPGIIAFVLILLTVGGIQGGTLGLPLGATILAVQMCVLWFCFNQAERMLSK